MSQFDSWSEALEPINNALAGTVRAYDSLRKLNTAPTQGSQAERELEHEPTMPVGLGRPIFDAYGMAAGMLDMALDHLEALRRTIAAPPRLWAAKNLARSIFELVGRAQWLLDPACDDRQRIARSLTMRLASLGESVRDGATLASGADPAQVIAAIVEWADGAGFTTGSTRHFHYVGKPLPSSSQFAGLAAMGDVLYRAYAAAGHGTLHALLASVESEPGLEGGRVTVRFNEIPPIAAAAFLAINEAVLHWIDFNGWERWTWNGWARRALQLLAPFIRALADESN
jgi:hypothetical protein